MTHFAESWDPFCGMTIDEYADRQNRLHHWAETGIYPLQGSTYRPIPKKRNLRPGERPGFDRLKHETNGEYYGKCMG